MNARLFFKIPLSFQIHSNRFLFSVVHPQMAINLILTYCLQGRGLVEALKSVGPRGVSACKGSCVSLHKYLWIQCHSFVAQIRLMHTGALERQERKCTDSPSVTPLRGQK